MHIYGPVEGTAEEMLEFYTKFQEILAKITEENNHILIKIMDWNAVVYKGSNGSLWREDSK